jgi:hypothetical protein
MVAATQVPGASVAIVARPHDVNINQPVQMAAAAVADGGGRNIPATGTQFRITDPSY